MCQPMVKGYFVIPQIQPLRNTNYITSLEPTLWRHILYFQQLQPSADICYIFYQPNQPSGGNTYKEVVFSVLYQHKHPFYLYAIKNHLNHIPICMGKSKISFTLPLEWLGKMRFYFLSKNSCENKMF